MTVKYILEDVYKRQLMGCSGVAPTVEAGGNFLLKGGKTFTASEGSQLTLRAFNDGSEAMKWIEPVSYTHLDVYKRQVGIWVLPTIRNFPFSGDRYSPAT